MAEFTVKWIKTDKIKPAAYNPRKDLQPGDPEYIKIQKSINEFGLVDPLVVNSDMTLIGGHQRLKVLIDAGFDKVPCSIVDLDKQQEKALNIALNKISGEWDFPKLKDLLVEIDVGDFDIEVTGFDADEMKEMFGIVGDRNDPSKEWAGMPEYEDDKPCFRHVIVKFDNAEDVDSFFKIIGQSCTDKTKSIWHPKKERQDNESYRWENE